MERGYRDQTHGLLINLPGAFEPDPRRNGRLDTLTPDDFPSFDNFWVISNPAVETDNLGCTHPSLWIKRHGPERNWDGAEKDVELHKAEVDWDGVERNVELHKGEWSETEGKWVNRKTAKPQNGTVRNGTEQNGAERNSAEENGRIRTVTRDALGVRQGDHVVLFRAGTIRSWKGIREVAGAFLIASRESTPDR
jgi:hypothetical protein